MNRQLYIATQAVVPMRKEPSESSEMVSQLLWGETMTVIDTQKGWAFVAAHPDGYTGWVDTKMICLTAHKDISVARITSIMAIVCCFDDECTHYLSMGSALPFYDPTQRIFFVGTRKYRLLSGDASQPEVFDYDLLHSYAVSLTNTPYLWGGRHFMGIDCSAYVQLIYRLCGIELPRDAADQARLGENVLRDQAKPGDIAFFDNAVGKITHVGIIIANDQIIHSSGWVRVDRLDLNGIFRLSDQTHSHHLCCIKRM